MRKVFGLFLLLATSFNHGAGSLTFAQTTAAQSTTETLEAQQLAGEFMSRMQTTRDLAALKDLFVSDFIRRSLNSNASSLPDVGSSPTVSRALVGQLRQADVERYYFAQVSLRYLSVLYLATAHSAKEISSFEKGETDGSDFMFPADVSVLLANSLINEEITTLQQFRDMLALLEKAAAMMRTRFQQSPPEQSKHYRENIGEWTLADVRLKQPKPSLSISSQEQSGFPSGTHFFHVITEPELFELTLVKTEAGVKIIWARVYPFN